MRRFDIGKGASTSLTLLAALALLCMSVPAAMRAQTPAKQAAIPLPPMGWSSWNSFSNTVDAQIVMAQAKAMVSTGMAKAGYRYVNIDEGWWLGQRDAEGNIVVEAKAWPALAAGEKPGDMANIVHYIHSLGLKAGIYTDAGSDGCSLYPDLGPVYHHTGSENHYEQDFLQFARWGFDYVKVDWCGGDKENLDPAIQYGEIARAIARAESITGHRLYFSICNWGKHSPWTWAPNIGGLPAVVWRTGGDIVAPIVAGTKNADRRAQLKEVFREFGEANHPEAEHTGSYNDPDMMVVGMPGLTEEQNRVHMALWAISGGPLLAGADLTRLSPEALATLTNPAALAIDQDALGLQAVKVAEAAKGLEVWSKPLAHPGARAVLLLNRTATAAPISVTLAELGLLDSTPAGVKDAWTGKALGSVSPSYSATVPAADAVLLLVQGREAPFTSYKAATAMPLRHGQPLAFERVTSRAPMARVRIVYTNPGETELSADLRVNGRIATRIAFPPTGGAPGAVTVLSLLDRAGAKNVLEFSAVCDPGPEIRLIAVQ